MEWSQSIKSSLRSKGKFKYFTRSSRTPFESDPKYEIWKAENSMVVAWLLHTMQLEISKTYLLLLTTKDIQEALNETYSKVGFTPKLFR